MVRYEHLPIYKAAMDAAAHFEQAVVAQMIRANSACERQPEIIRLRLAGEVKAPNLMHALHFSALQWPTG